MIWELGALKILARNETVPGVALMDAVNELERIHAEMEINLVMLNRAHERPGDVVQKRLNAENHVRGWLMRRLKKDGSNA